MPTLLNCGKWSTPTQNLQPGDLVWVLEDFIPRGLWPMARVDKVFPGADWVVRSCRLKTIYGYIHRPVVKLSKVPVDISNKTWNFALVLLEQWYQLSSKPFFGADYVVTQRFDWRISSIVINTWNLLSNFQLLIIRIAHCKFSGMKLFAN